MASPKPPLRWKHPVRDCILAVTGLGLLIVGYLVVWSFTAKPGGAVDYAAAMRDLVASHQPAPADSTSAGGEDAWRLLEDALAEFETALGTVPLAPAVAGGVAQPIDFSLLLAGTYEAAVAQFPGADHPEYGARVADLEAQRAAAEAAVPLIAVSPLTRVLERLAESRGGQRVQLSTPLSLIPLPELGQIRRLARYLAVRAQLAASTGDTATVLACLEQTLALARILAHNGTLIERLVAFAISNLGLEELRRHADRGGMNADDARLALALLDRQSAWPGMELPIEGERLLALDMIQLTHSSGGLLDGRLLYAVSQQLTNPAAGVNTSSPLYNLLGLLAPSKRQTIKAIDQFYDGLISNLPLARGERSARGFDADAFLNSLSPRQELVRLLVPAMGQPMLQADTHQAILGLTRLRLALLAHHLAHGAYPDSIDTLGPAMLAALPIDPFAADGRFLYRREGDGFVLYSVGYDGVDNGGTPDPDRNAAAFFSDAQGIDYVLRAAPP